jgi:hypothetical protein
MDEAVAFKTCGEGGKLNVLFQVDADVVRLAAIVGHVTSL